MDYFRANHRFADFVVHEEERIFHNCKRRTLGLPETRRHEWLLEIDLKKRETFAYACEAYSRVLELADGPTRGASCISNSKVDPSWGMRWRARDYLEAVRAAIAARNGWKRILHAYAPPWARLTRSLDQPA
jgi:hypothetical protein